MQTQESLGDEHFDSATLGERPTGWGFYFGYGNAGIESAGGGSKQKPYANEVKAHGCAWSQCGRR